VASSIERMNVFNPNGLHSEQREKEISAPTISDRSPFQSIDICIAFCVQLFIWAMIIAVRVRAVWQSFSGTNGHFHGKIRILIAISQEICECEREMVAGVLLYKNHFICQHTRTITVHRRRREWYAVVARDRICHLDI